MTSLAFSFAVIERSGRNIVRHGAFACLGLIALLGCQSAAQERIGSAASLRNQVEGVISGGLRPIEVGSEVYQNELVRTGEASVVQLVFLDNTDLRVGPKSEVTLDRFVYDPDRSAGSVVVRAVRGIFRFVTGSQQKRNYLIQTPIASIGVRGTIFDLLVLPDRITVILVEGEIDVTTLLGRVVALTQPGASVTVFANGSVAGPRTWRGTIHIDFANAEFPYFGPVPIPTRPAGPVIRRSSLPKDNPPRRSGRQVYVTPGVQRPVDVDTWQDRHGRHLDHSRDRDRRHADNWPGRNMGHVERATGKQGRMKTYRSHGRSSMYRSPHF